MYAQSPESMKGMLTGLFYFIYSIFNGGSSILFYLFLQHRWKNPNYAIFYWMLLAMAVFGLVIYTIAACLYVNRRRPTSETEETEETGLFYNNISMP